MRFPREQIADQKRDDAIWQAIQPLLDDGLVAKIEIGFDPQQLHDALANDEISLETFKKGLVNHLNSTLKGGFMGRDRHETNWREVNVIDFIEWEEA